jgi:transcriptional regulator GlxA family with amidase domain
VPGKVASPGAWKVALELARIPSNLRHAAGNASDSEDGLSGAMKISIVTFDDFTDLDLFILWDLLKRVESPGWEVKILGDKESHVSVTGIEVRTHGRLEEANDSDAVLFCSGNGTRRKVRDEAFLGAFRLDERRQLLGAIDSGALLLGALGLLKGRRATSYPSAEIKRMLEEAGAEVVWDSFVREGNVATAAQCLSGQHLVGWVVESLAGAEQKEKVLRSAAPLDAVEVSL